MIILFSQYDKEGKRDNASQMDTLWIKYLWEEW